jgi:hypothetical protein
LDFLSSSERIGFISVGFIRRGRKFSSNREGVEDEDGVSYEDVRVIAGIEELNEDVGEAGTLEVSEPPSVSECKCDQSNIEYWRRRV